MQVCFICYIMDIRNFVQHLQHTCVFGVYMSIWHTHVCAWHLWMYDKCVRVFVCEYRCMAVMMCLWRSENNLKSCFFSFPFEGDTEYARLAGLWAPGDCPVSVSHLPVGVLGSQMCMVCIQLACGFRGLELKFSRLGGKYFYPLSRFPSTAYSCFNFHLSHEIRHGIFSPL